MTPHQKAIEAAAKTRFERRFDVPWASASKAQQSFWTKEAQLDLYAALASARETGWELVPVRPTEQMISDAKVDPDWVAPRFEDAP